MNTFAHIHSVSDWLTLVPVHTGPEIAVRTNLGLPGDNHVRANPSMHTDGYITTEDNGGTRLP